MTNQNSASHSGHTTAPLRPWLVLAAFGVLSIGLTWPLVVSLNSRVPGTATWAFDESTFLWNIWYFKHALINLHTSPLHTDLIWFPLGIDLILYTYNFSNALLALPLLLATSLPFASNVTLLLGTVLSGFGTYLLVLYMLRPTTADRHSFSPAAVRWAALLAGIVYAFGSNRAVYAALGHYDMVATQWLPFFALYLLKTLQQSRLRNAVLAGLFFALVALVEMTFASFLAIFSLVAIAASWRRIHLRRSALARLFMLPGAQYSDPEFSWKWEVAPGGIGFVKGRALGPQFEGDLFMGAATANLEGGYLFHFNLTGNREKIGVDDPRLDDRVADNLAKHDITESESLLIGRNFGVVTDIETGSNGNLFVVSLSQGTVYEIFRR